MTLARILALAALAHAATARAAPPARSLRSTAAFAAPPALVRRRPTSRRVVARAAAAADDDDDDDDDAAASRWPTLGALTLVQAHNQLSRTLLFSLVNFAPASVAGADAAFLYANVDLGFDAAQYGALASVGFAAVFAVIGLYAGGLADRFDRGALNAGSAVAWSAATAASGAATAFEPLAGLRLATGGAQAFTAVAGYPVVERLFRGTGGEATAASIYSFGIYIGVGLASLAIFVDESIGWRATFGAVGAAGLAVAAVSAAVVRDPRTAAAEAAGGEEGGATRTHTNAAVDEPLSTFDAAALVLESPAARLLLLASALRFAAGLTIQVWCAPLFRERFADAAGGIALANAGGIALAGGASSLAGGFLADKLAPSLGDARARAVVPAAGALLAAPFWAGAAGLGPLAGVGLDFYGAATLLVIQYGLCECWFGPTIATLQTLAPARAQGVAQALFQGSALLGNAAPAFVGLAVTSGWLDLATCSGTVASGAFVLSAAAFLASGEAARDEELAREM